MKENNNARMREALRAIHALLGAYIRHEILDVSLCLRTKDVIKVALDAPARNCDLYTNYGDAVRAFEDNEDAESFEDIGEWLYAEEEV